MTVPLILSEIFRTITIMSISGGILAIVLLILKPIILHRLPKSAQYYMWVVVLFALLVPISQILVLPENTPIPTAPIHNIVQQNIISLDEEIVRVLYPQLQSPLNENPPAMHPQLAHHATLPIPTLPLAPMLSILMLIYPIIVSVILAYNTIAYIIFNRRLSRANTASNPNETALLKELAPKRNIAILRNKKAATPMLIGIMRPKIILPDIEYTNEQLKLILLHEITHMKRHDIVIKWLALFACALHWFNPIVWIARKQIDKVCEIACDDAVISQMDNAAKQQYGNTLISVAAETKLPLAIVSTTMAQQKSVLKERLCAIMKSKKSTKLAILTSILLILTAGLIACGLGAASSIDSQGMSENGNAAEIADQLQIGMTRAAMEQLLGEPSQIITRPMDNATLYRFDISFNGGYIFNDEHGIGLTDIEGLQNGEVDLIAFIGFDFVPFVGTFEATDIDIYYRDEHGAIFQWRVTPWYSHRNIISGRNQPALSLDEMIVLAIDYAELNLEISRPFESRLDFYALSANGEVGFAVMYFANIDGSKIVIVDANGEVWLDEVFYFLGEHMELPLSGTDLDERERVLGEIGGLAFNQAYQYIRDDGLYAMMVGWYPFRSNEEFMRYFPYLGVPDNIGDFRLLSVSVNNRLGVASRIFHSPMHKPPNSLYNAQSEIAPIGEIFTYEPIANAFYAIYQNPEGDLLGIGVYPPIFPLANGLNDFIIGDLPLENNEAFFVSYNHQGGLVMEIGFLNAAHTTPNYWSYWSWAWYDNLEELFIPTDINTLEQLVREINPDALFEQFNWQLWPFQ
ncbi:MAG: M56 family metallopeptidase [Defluviitaleaceae bacterium]|nr:M56 family metallopeptidase [Defluviitaleaceae bacterium]